MTYTENYHLKKPDGEDFIDIEDLNQNMDAIDAQLKAQAQKAEGDGTKVQEVQAALEQKADLKNGKVPAEQLPAMDYIASADRGAPGGVATLGSDGKVPEGQLPAMNYDPKGTAVTAVSNHNSSAGAHADIRQAVANTQAAAQQAASALQSGLDSHTGNKDNPHNVTCEQIGAAAASHTHSANDLTSAVPISKGGTGATTAERALTNLGGMKTDLSNMAFELMWSKSKMPSSNWWTSICYGDGRFVAVASDSTKAAYSTDGITWKEKYMLNPSSPWQSVCYGKGKFVAVAYGSDKAARSYSELNWMISSMPSSANWIRVCYGKDKFVAVAYGSDKAAYSIDGITWKTATLPESASWQTLCYGNGKFVAIAWGSTTAAYSTDGINWTKATMPISADWCSVCYGKDKFVAVVNGSDKAAYSIDGITWKTATLPVFKYWRSVCYGNGKFVVASESDYSAAYSLDGITWKKTTLPFYVNNQPSICYGNDRFVVISSGDSNGAYADATPSAVSQFNAMGLTRMQLVSYVGTGTYGSSNQCSLEFDFMPKVVLYLGGAYSYSDILDRYTSRAMFPENGNPTTFYARYGFSKDIANYPSYASYSENGTKIYWYNETSAEYQLNSSGRGYYFLALT